MHINGATDPHFESVRRAFGSGFDAGRDVGAAVAVWHRGAPVVDLWAGHTDRAREHAWQQDTLCCGFSITKAMTAICILQAVADGHLRLDDRVADYWPEFTANGKQEVTLRQLLSHRAGLVGFHDPMPRDLYFDWTATTQALAAEHPWWPPGERHGYHARTYGFLLGEVLHRATGLTVGEWFRQRIAVPYDIDFHIGLAEADLARCADMLPARIRPGEERSWPDPMRRMLTDMGDPSTPTGAAFQNPTLRPGYMNQRAFRTANLPALNGHGTARAIAQVFSMLGAGTLLPPALLEEATTTHSLGPDEVLKSITRFGLGFMLHHPEAPVSGDNAFGHAGAGGSLAFYDPGNEVAFCFLMNQMQEGVVTGGESASVLVQDLTAVINPPR
jgi:CubicO group peptidase (beta-lactamase class C family)